MRPRRSHAWVNGPSKMSKGPQAVNCPESIRMRGSDSDPPACRSSPHGFGREVRGAPPTSSVVPCNSPRGPHIPSRAAPLPPPALGRRPSMIVRSLPSDRSTVSHGRSDSAARRCRPGRRSVRIDQTRERLGSRYTIWMSLDLLPWTHVGDPDPGCGRHRRRDERSRTVHDGAKRRLAEFRSQRPKRRVSAAAGANPVRNDSERNGRRSREPDRRSRIRIKVEKTAA